MYVLHAISAGIRSAQTWTLRGIEGEMGAWSLDLNDKVTGRIYARADLAPYALVVVKPLKGPYNVLIRCMTDDGYMDIFYTVTYGRTKNRGKLMVKFVRSVTFSA